MPVSTDGVLLGAWTNLAPKSSVLDIGTGTGLLALMTAQRYEDASIFAIDIDLHAIDAATINIEQSQWQDRISLHHGSVLTADFSQRFDAIICNPPYSTLVNRRSKAKEQRPDIQEAWITFSLPCVVSNLPQKMQPQASYCRLQKEKVSSSLPSNVVGI